MIPPPAPNPGGAKMTASPPNLASDPASPSGARINRTTARKCASWDSGWVEMLLAKKLIPYAKRYPLGHPSEGGIQELTNLKFMSKLSNAEMNNVETA